MRIPNNRTQIKLPHTHKVHVHVYDILSDILCIDKHVSELLYLYIAETKILTILYTYVFQCICAHWHQTHQQFIRVCQIPMKTTHRSHCVCMCVLYYMSIK